jgi:DNA-binding GntR family transcriptional regulator
MRPSPSGTVAWLFVFEHDHDFHKLVGKLAGQEFVKSICQFAVIPQLILLWLLKAAPHSRSNFRLTQVAKNGSRIVNFV